MRHISEKTIITALVNLKCVGYLGKSVTHLTTKERGYVIDQLLERGWVDEHMNVLPRAKETIIKNLHLAQH